MAGETREESYVKEPRRCSPALGAGRSRDGGCFLWRGRRTMRRGKKRTASETTGREEQERKGWKKEKETMRRQELRYKTTTTGPGAV